ncbi:MAG: zinc-dependent alcohol dehydrogenase family protein [Deltaproteobacteria bacterium]|nr:zinc-dependent alcohol dehydrogenase family protein [Deltaproteobacteria bacterium]
MRAMLLENQAAIVTAPLVAREIETPAPGPGGVRLRVRACGICHTDLHIVEGDLAPRRMPIVPGHQVVGEIDAVGEGVEPSRIGSRVGLPWLHRTCGECKYCRTDRENLCDDARFTGWDVNGGFAEWCVAPADFVIDLPPEIDAAHAAPLLCAGIIGYRSLRLSGAAPGSRLGLVGFGAAAHIAIQIAVARGIEVHVATRSTSHRRLAADLGASWCGDADDSPPHRWDAAIIFAPAGELVAKTLRNMEKGATIALGGIHMSPIGPIDYADWWGERVIRTVANSTRDDGRELVAEAARVGVKSHVTEYALADANRALADLKASRIDGAGVMIP